jgi:recombinational DNA repair ATPase RecF
MIDGCFIDDKQMNQVVTHLHNDEEEDVRNIIAQIKDIHASIEDSSSEVTSNRSNTHTTPMDEPQEDKEQDFVEGLQKKYDGDHSDLALSSQSA